MLQLDEQRLRACGHSAQHVVSEATTQPHKHMTTLYLQLHGKTHVCTQASVRSCQLRFERHGILRYAPITHEKSLYHRVHITGIS